MPPPPRRVASREQRVEESDAPSVHPQQEHAGVQLEVVSLLEDAARIATDDEPHIPLGILCQRQLKGCVGNADVPVEPKYPRRGLTTARGVQRGANLAPEDDQLVPRPAEVGVEYGALFARGSHAVQASVAALELERGGDPRLGFRGVARLGLPGRDQQD